MLYDQGRGVPKDYSLAAQWYRKAAEQGNDSAQFNLGMDYETGQGVPQDYGQAVQWYRKAAAQGNDHAQAHLGSLYAVGRGVPQNNVVAYALFNLLATPASSVIKIRSFLTTLMSQQEIEAGQALTRRMNAPGQLLKALDDYMASPK
jgi:hypothetical protein